MIIHSPIISGSLTFSDGASLSLPNPTTVSGSFSGSAQFSTIGSNLIPDTSGAYDLGSEAYPFQDLWLVGSTINLGGISLGGVSSGLNITQTSGGASAGLGVSSLTLGGALGSGGSSKKFNLNDKGDLQVSDTSGNPGVLTVSSVIVSGSGGAVTMSLDSGGNLVQTAGDVSALSHTSGSFTGSIQDGIFNGDATFNNGIGVTGTSTLGVVNASGLISADGGLDVDGAFTVADTTGNVVTTGTLSAGNTDVATLDASGLASLDGGVNVDDNFTVDTSGNTSVGGTLDASGLASLDGGIDVDGAFTVADTSGNVSTTGTLGAGNTTITGTADVTGLASLDGGIDVDGAFTVADSTGNVVTTGTITVPEGSLTLGSTAVTSTATELNVLDGIPAGLTATELGYVDGVTSNIQTQLDNISDVNTNLITSQSVQETAISIVSGSQNVTIQGNLTVQGTQTQLNTATLNIEDKNLLIASGAADSAAANGGGITIDGADATITWVDADSNIAFNTAVNIPASSLKLDGTAVTSTATELNFLDTAAAGTITNSKAVVYGSSGEVNATTLQIGGTSITATATELNQLDDNTVGGTTAGDIVTIDGSQTLSNKTIAASQVTEISNLTAAEGEQLENIDSVTISNTQWGYLGAADQAIATTDDVSFNTININATTASTTKTTGALIVDGGVGIDGALNVGGDIVAYASSDERLKDNIEVISNPIEKVQQLKGVTWDWNDNADELQKSLPNVGVIAQDVEKVLPQLVKDRDNGFKAVDYDKIVGLLIEAIKDQQAQIDDLKSKI